MPRAPDFWAGNSRSPWPVLLSPLAAAYRLASRLNRSLATPQDAGIPVISVGNLVAGGAGKTPVAIALAGCLRRIGQTPHMLTRGYGGSLIGPVRVDPLRHRADETGDEALLLAEAAPTWVARDRVAGARAAAAAGASCVIADDAHQTWRLERAMSLLVVDGGYGFGNGRLLPAGPLREPVHSGLSRSDAVVVVGPRSVELPSFGALPVFDAEFMPDPQDAARLRNRRVLAFAGIGRPEKFFASLRRLGSTVVGTRAFPDHAPYSEDTVMRLVEQAHDLDAVPVTTAKDLTRLPPDAHRMVEVLRVSLVFAAADAVERFLLSRLSA